MRFITIITKPYRGAMMAWPVGPLGLCAAVTIVRLHAAPASRAALFVVPHRVTHLTDHSAAHQLVCTQSARFTGLAGRAPSAGAWLVAPVQLLDLAGRVRGVG